MVKKGVWLHTLKIVYKFPEYGQYNVLTEDKRIHDFRQITVLFILFTYWWFSFIIALLSLTWSNLFNVKFLVKQDKRGPIIKYYINTTINY